MYCVCRGVLIRCMWGVLCRGGLDKVYVGGLMWGGGLGKVYVGS